MESSLSNGEALRRYEAIEKAYCEGRWDMVLEAGTVLLRDLPGDGADGEIQGVRHRMHLLMAHTLLHGFGDRDAAEDLYLLVQNSNAESSLRQMAEDGLDQCHKPLSSSFVPDETEEDEEPLGRPQLFLPDTEPARPDDLAAAPERGGAPVIALHRGAPPGPSQATPPSEDGIAPTTARQKEEVAADLGLAADPFQPATAPASPDTLHLTVPVMPWAPPQEATETATAEPTTGAKTEDDAPPGLSDETLVPSLTLRPLIPEVVEEPELVEVHQADPTRAEEVELELTSSDGDPALEEAGDGVEPHLGEPVEDLRSSLLLFKLG